MIPLTVRSYYSLMWGTCSPERICAVAKQLGYTQLALTDTDNLYGLWPFLKSCERENITPVVGAELTEPVSGCRAVCLVENEQGYGNLCRLITRRHSDSAFDLKSNLPDHARGLTVLTRSPALLPEWYEAGVRVAGAAVGRPDGTAFELRKMCKHLGVPVVATPGSFFLDPEDTKIHRMLRAVDLNTSLSRLTPKDVAPSDAWLAPASKYAERFAIWPDAIRSGHKITERLTYTGPCPGLVLPPWSNSQGQSAMQLLGDAAYKGARKRYGDDFSETVVDRLEHELRIIEKMGFSSYFLVVQDMQFAHLRSRKRRFVPGGLQFGYYQYLSDQA